MGYLAPLASGQTSPAADVGPPPAASKAAAAVWEFREGAWVAVAQPTSQPAGDAELDRIAPVIEQGRFKEAREALKTWDKANKTSPVRDQALWLFADLYYRWDDPVRAFYHLDELLDTYPDSRLYYPAVEWQYAIAEKMLTGPSKRFLGIPIGSGSERGVQMLYRIQQRVPGSPLAERALLRTADFYYSNGDYDFAADAYAAYARNYPRSPLAARAQLRQAYSNLAQFRGSRFDPTPLLDARTQLNDLRITHPELAEAETIPAIVDRIDQDLVRKLSYTAGFYRRTHKPEAAMLLYEKVVQTFPDSPEAQDARQWLATMESATAGTADRANDVSTGSTPAGPAADDETTPGRTDGPTAGPDVTPGSAGQP